MDLSPIYPVTSESIKSHLGKPAVVLLVDSTAKYGILEGIENESLLLDSIHQSSLETSTARSRTRRKSLKTRNLIMKLIGKSGKKRLRVKAVTPDSESNGIPLMMISSLYVLPDRAKKKKSAPKDSVIRP